MSEPKNKNSRPRTGFEIAVIGMAGRFPGAKTIAEFRENLKKGVESITFFSDEELIEAGVDAETFKNPYYIKAKGLLEDSEYFDASFFNYNPKEAEMMDPQVRVFHEVAWQALEDAGYEPISYPGLISLYAGSSPNTMWKIRSLIHNKSLSEQFEAENLNSQFFSTLICYKLNLKGVGAIINTACSTSLVAVHMACRALLTGEADMALAGGVSITLPQKSGYFYQEGMVNSPKGHCKPFDAEADGTIAGNGIGVVVLKRLVKAIADRDHIYAVVKGTAANNDGNRKTGYAAPSVEAQAEVIRSALRMAEVKPEWISYIETHGTGTPLGDPIEIEALKIAFKTDKKRFCRLGALKANIGHLDAAAGIAGFIKTVLILKHRFIPPMINFDTPNPALDFENTPFVVNTELYEWGNDDYPLAAGVSSFGIGGTNAHVILEEAPVIGEGSSVIADTGKNQEHQLILLSAGTETALAKMTRNLAEFLQENNNVPLADAAYTLKVGRRVFAHRRMLVCSTPEEAIDGLLSASSPDTGKVRDYFKGKENEDRPVVFMFPGLGHQYVNLGRELYETEPLFRQEMDGCFEILNTLVDYDIKEILYPNLHTPVDINQAEVAQPVLFIFEYALAKLLMHWGIRPYAMIGYSFGEYVAACIAGVFSLEDALRLVSVRGKLIRRIPAGAMLSVPLPAADLKPLLNDELSLAVDNGFSCIVSGSNRAIDAFEKQMKEKKYLCVRPGGVSHAIHSMMMNSILKEFEAEVAKLTLMKPQIPYISNVTGRWAAVDEVVKPGYWATHLRETVRFAGGLQKLLEIEKALLVEVGPGVVLSTLAMQYIDKKSDQGPRVVNLVRSSDQDISDVEYLLRKIGRLWLYGEKIDWPAFYGAEKRYRVPLPTYPFDKHFYSVDVSGLNHVLNRLLSGSESPVSSIFGEIPAPRAAESVPSPGLKETAAPQKPLDDKPGNRVEQLVVEMWEKLMGIKPIGIHDNFFALGGDSLKGITFVNQLKDILGETVHITVLFDAPTPAELAAYFKKHYPDGYARMMAEGEYEEKETTSPAYKSIEEFYPLSFGQERLWFLEQLEDLGSTYNEWISLRLKGPLQIAPLEQGFNEIVRRHEVLRTTFSLKDGQPTQVVGAVLPVPLPKENLSHLHGEEQLERMVQRAVEEVERPFNLGKGPLLRVKLFMLGPDDHGLVVTMHHIVSDAWSIDILIREMASLYNAYVNGESSTLPELPKQYKDFASWQRQWLRGEVLKAQVDYWKKQMEGAPAVLELPFDHPRPAQQTFQGETLSFEITPHLTKELNRFIQSTGTSLFMVLLAAFSILLSRLSGKDDIVIGTPAANRSRKEFEPLIGFFLNTLLIRLDLTGSLPFPDYLYRVRKVLLGAYDNQDIPFEKLVEELEPERNLSHSPLFQVLFTYQNVDSTGSEFPGLSITPFEIKRVTSKFDLSLFMSGMPGDRQGLKGVLEYNTDLFEKDTTARTAGLFQNLLEEIAAHPDRQISQLSLLTESQRHRLVVEWNNTRTGYPKHKTLHHLFDEQTGKTPDGVAVVGKGQLAIGKEKRKRETVQLTYGKLKQKSDHVARVLIEKGVLADDIIAIMLERSVEMIIGILGILKAGGAYLPIDPDYPQKRIDYMLKDSKAKILLTENELSSWLSSAPKALLNLPEGRLIHHSSNQLITHHSGHLSYVIYTSGSTGKPRGVMVEHRNVVNFITGITSEIEFHPGRTILAVTTISFDIFVLETMLPLTRGVKIAIADEVRQRDPELLADLIVKNKVNMLQFTPSRLHLLLSRSKETAWLEGIEELMIGGEALPGHLFRRLRDVFRGKIYNLYGPTETTVWSTLKDLTTMEKITIGRPISNTYIYILDGHGMFQPVGVPGELFIGGDGVARGYLNNPEITAEKFRRVVISHLSFVISSSESVTNDQCPMTNDRLYRTGDLARWLADGNIEFLGRMDHQVKVRGFRVELEEIEKQMSNHEHVKEAVIAAKTDKSGDTYLCAYVVGIDGTEFDKTSHHTKLREYLSETLPDYMIPSYFVPMEKIPLTPNGKIDRKAFPEPGWEVGEEYAAARNEVEKRVVEIWWDVLGTDRNLTEVSRSSLDIPIGIDDNFFHLGGHSLKAIAMISKIHEAFDINIPLASLFKTPTVRELAGFIKGAIDDYNKFAAIEPVEKKEYYPLSSAQKRLYITQQTDLENTVYNILSLVSLEGALDRIRLENTFRKLIQRHESLRTSFDVHAGEPVQRIHDDVDFEIEYYEATGDTEEEERRREEEKKRRGEEKGTDENLAEILPTANRQLPTDFVHPFDLSQAPLIRVGLIHTPSASRPPLSRGDDTPPSNHPSQEGIAGNKHLLLVDMHHIITDGSSTAILMYEFMMLYSNAGKELPPLSLQYKDFSEWQNSEPRRKSTKKQEAYWLKEFGIRGEIPVLELITDYPRDSVQSFAGHAVNFSLDEDESRALKQSAKEEEVTVFMVLLAIVNILLSKLSGQEDIIIGTIAAGRRHTALQSLIGMFVNTLAIRNYPHREKTLRAFLKEIKENTLAAFENQDYPFEDLVEKVVPVRDAGRNPLFDVLFTFQNMDIPGIKIPGLVLKPHQYETHLAKFDLNLIGMEQGDKFNFVLEYRTTLFKEETIKEFVNYFKEVTTAVLGNRDIKLSDIDISIDLSDMGPDSRIYQELFDDFEL